MSGQPIYDPRCDPTAILDALPEKWHPVFLAEYWEAVKAASKPEEFHQLPELLHRWWLRSLVFADPAYEQRAHDAANGTGQFVSIEEAIPDWVERVKARRR